ncbi:MAG: alanine racemase [Rickettsia sp.]|nr:alanine racemase [Rickettsia sp.]
MIKNQFLNAFAEINLQNIKDNFLLIQKKALGVEIGAVVKANAYGLGIKYVAPILEKAACRNFFVSSFEEALELKNFLEKDSNIFILHGVYSINLEEVIVNNFITVINNLEQLELLLQASVRKNKKLPCILNFNLSMYRLGISVSEIDDIYKRYDLSSLKILYIMGHLSSSDESESQKNEEELKKFINICSKFSNNVKKSLANSNAIKLGSKYFFDLIRSGSAIYGITRFSKDHLLDQDLKEVVSIYTHIIQINKVSKGELIGYNGTFRAKKDMILAVVPLGYADGYIRIFSNNSYVYIDCYRLPVVGSVSMDLSIIDVSYVPQELLFIGQKVEIIGQNQSIYSLSKIANTISYEVLTVLMLSKRIRKVIT